METMLLLDITGLNHILMILVNTSWTKHHQYNNFHLIFKLTECSMLTIPVWTDDHKLLQESNLTIWHSRKVNIMSYI